MAQLARNGYDIAIPMAVESDPVVCAQIKLQDEFWLNLGEWFLNVNEGIPYLVQSGTSGTVGIMAVKNPNIGNITALYRSIILGTPGIVAVKQLIVNFNPATRNFSYTFAAVCNTGAIVTGGDTPFVVGALPQ